MRMYVQPKLLLWLGRVNDMVKRIGLNGDEAVALAVKQANVDVIAAYPITPQTIIVERLSEYVNNGELDAEFVPVESEHSALSTVVGAALTGARVFTATASQGLALMYEILWIASSLRLPIVMALANRAFSAPINIHCSHDDAMAARDAGWIELFSESVQEVYDLTLQAFMMVEDENIMLPAIVNLDGFILSHSLADLYVFDDQEVTNLLRKDRPLYKLPIDFKKPATYGPLGLYDYYMEIKKQQAVAMRNAYKYIKEVFQKYSEVSGREYSPVKTYEVEDAEIVVIALGSMAGNLRTIAKSLRKRGKKVGVISLTLYRPFPEDIILKTLKDINVVVVMDRFPNFGAPGGPLFEDISATLYHLKKRPMLLNVIYGLGGRETSPKEIENIFERALKISKEGVMEEKEIWVGVRE